MGVGEFDFISNYNYYMRRPQFSHHVLGKGSLYYHFLSCLPNTTTTTTTKKIILIPIHDTQPQAHCMTPLPPE